MHLKEKQYCPKLSVSNLRVQRTYSFNAEVNSESFNLKKETTNIKKSLKNIEIRNSP